MAKNDEDIFYSDEELSDSEVYAPSYSKYFTSRSESIFSSRLRQNSSGTLSPEESVRAGSTNTAGKVFNTIDSPINQISSGITNLNLLVKESRPAFPGQSSKPISWSSIAKKEPLQTIKPQNNIPKPLPKSYKPKQEKTISTKVNESAVSAGYRFKAKNPEADPRYPAAHQLMVGPIPGHLDHDVIYNGLRAIFQSRGPVCFMFVHKSAVKDNDSGKMVKFGYVVFAEKASAQRVLKEGSITFNGGNKIQVKMMAKI